MTLEATAFGKDALRRTATGFEVRAGLWSYRSLPLSCVEEIGVTIDGWTPSPEDLRIVRNGKPYTLAALAEMVDEEWFVLDKMVIQTPPPPEEITADEVILEFRLAMRIPYIIMGPGVAMVQRSHVQNKVSVQ